MKRRLLHTLTTVAVVSCLFAAPVFAAPVSVTSVPAAPQGDIEALEQKKSRAEAQAANVNGELVNLLVDYNALQKDMKAQEKKIRQAEKDLKSAKKKEKKQYEAMKLRIKYMYEEGDASFASALITSDSYADLVNKAEYVQKVHNYDRRMLDKYVETKNEVAELKDGLEAGEAEMRELSGEMERQKDNLESTLTAMREQISDFESQLAQAKEAAQEELRRIEEAQKAAEETEKQAEEAKTEEPDQSGQGEPAAGKKDGEASGKNDVGKDGEASGKSSRKKDGSEKGESGKNTAKKDSAEKSGAKKEEAAGEPEIQDGGSVSTAADSGNAALGQRIADTGCQYIGNKYVYGGNSLTGGIDCSGFVHQIHSLCGISTPRSSGDFRSQGKSVSYADKLPGDVICYSGHVAIYIGNNQIVHASNSAPYPKGGIKISSPANYRTVLAVRRYW